MDADKRLRVYIALVESIDILNRFCKTTDPQRHSLYERLERLHDSLGFKEAENWLEGLKK